MYKKSANNNKEFFSLLCIMGSKSDKNVEHLTYLYNPAWFAFDSEKISHFLIFVNIILLLTNPAGTILDSE
jgi:hypothetical protein